MSEPRRPPPVDADHDTDVGKPSNDPSRVVFQRPAAHIHNQRPARLSLAAVATMAVRSIENVSRGQHDGAEAQQDRHPGGYVHSPGRAQHDEGAENERQTDAAEYDDRVGNRRRGAVDEPKSSVHDVHLVTPRTGEQASLPQPSHEETLPRTSRRQVGCPAGPLDSAVTPLLLAGL